MRAVGDLHVLDNVFCWAFGRGRPRTSGNAGLFVPIPGELDSARERTLGGGVRWTFRPTESRLHATSQFSNAITRPLRTNKCARNTGVDRTWDALVTSPSVIRGHRAIFISHLCPCRCCCCCCCSCYRVSVHPFSRLTCNEIIASIDAVQADHTRCLGPLLLLPRVNLCRLHFLRAPTRWRHIREAYAVALKAIAAIDATTASVRQTPLSLLLMR